MTTKKLNYQRNCFRSFWAVSQSLLNILILSRLENCFRPHSYGNWVSLISAFQRKWIQMELWNGDKPLKNMSHPNWNANVTEHKLQSIWINHLLSGCLPIWLKLYLPAMRYLSPLSHDNVVCVKLVDGPLNKRSWNWTTQNMTFQIKFNNIQSYLVVRWVFYFRNHLKKPLKCGVFFSGMLDVFFVECASI